MRKILAPLVILALLAAMAPLPGGVRAALPSGEAATVRVNVRVALVVFDGGSWLNAGGIAAQALALVKASGPEEVLSLPGNAFARVRLAYNVSIDAFQAPPPAVKGLREALESLYQPTGRPPWLPATAEGPPGGYALVPLLDAYDAVVEAALDVIRGSGGDPASYTDVVVILGNLDDVARIYVEERDLPYPPGHVVLEGVRGWGTARGEAPPATFYDLAAPVKPWPDYPVPFHDRAPPASPRTEPWIWGLRDPAGYAANLVADHILFHVVGDMYKATPLLEVNATVVVLRFPGAEDAASRLAGEVDAGALEWMARLLAPWLDVNVTVVVADAPQRLVRLYEEAPRDNGTVALDYVEVAEALHAAHRGDCVLACNWTAYVLATPEPSHLTTPRRDLNFTGVSLGPTVILSYPGYHGRLLKSGLTRALAHELGHSMGEGHPFSYHGRIRWLMDEQATPMSYMDYGQAAYRGVYAYTAMREALLALLVLGLQGDDEAMEAALSLASNYTYDNALKAAGLAVEIARGQGQPPATPTPTPTTPPATTTATPPPQTTTTTTTTTTATPAASPPKATPTPTPTATPATSTTTGTPPAGAPPASPTPLTPPPIGTARWRLNTAEAVILAAIALAIAALALRARRP